MTTNQSSEIKLTSIDFNTSEDKSSHLNQSIARIENDYIDSLRELSEIYESQENWKGLIRCYKQLIAVAPDNTSSIDVYLKLAKLYKRRGEIYREIATYQDLIEIEPDSPASVYRELGNLLSQKRNNTLEALHVYKKAETLKEEWQPGFYIRIADLLIKQAEYEQAIDYLNKAIAINPDMPYCYMLMGNAYAQMKSFNEAIQNYTRAIQIKPDHFNAYKRIGDILCQKNELTTAARCYLKALQINPQATHINRLLGDIFLKQGKSAEAQHYYQQVNA